MDEILILHISSSLFIIILSIVLLVNSIKTKNKLAMFLSIGTLVVSLGCLTYCLIHHFNQQHHNENHVTLPTLTVSKAVYNKSRQNIKKILDEYIKTTSPDKEEVFTKPEYYSLKKCLSSSQVISDLTHQLLKNKGDTFIEKMVEIMIKAKEGTRSGSSGPDDYTADDRQTGNEFFQNMLTIMKNDCKDAKKVVEKIHKLLFIKAKQ